MVDSRVSSEVDCAARRFADELNTANQILVDLDGTLDDPADQVFQYEDRYNVTSLRIKDGCVATFKDGSRVAWDEASTVWRVLNEGIPAVTPIPDAPRPRKSSYWENTIQRESRERLLELVESLRQQRRKAQRNLVKAVKRLRDQEAKLNEAWNANSDLLDENDKLEDRIAFLTSAARPHQTAGLLEALGDMPGVVDAFLLVLRRGVVEVGVVVHDPSIYPTTLPRNVLKFVPAGSRLNVKSYTPLYEWDVIVKGGEA